jgi:large subunit ribosomal protein L23
MALFKKDSDTKKEVVVKEDLSWVLVKPRITEKAAMVSENNVFVFDVATRANKVQVKRAIISQYKVTPLKVNIISKKPRKVMKRGRKVHQAGTKKAMVFLKKGDTIELV